MNWTYNNEKVIVAYILPEVVGTERLLLRTIRLLTNPTTTSDFFSLIRSNDEWTIIISEKNFHLISDIVNGPTAYSVFQLHESQTYMQQTGLVANVSALLSAANIDILYLTSYNSNYVFVPE
ncbi:ACT domain-containing protein, partial [Candidatus Saccharibacteria bacterium]|nr:ACT domain-containing protein [Candidatus Saccharibacteria bacterium]